MEQILNPRVHTGIEPAAGKLLIAAPYLIDPHFARAVVLLCDHDAEGSVGFVLNRATDTTLDLVFPELDNDHFNVNEGGPVGTDTLHVIHRTPYPMGGKEIIPSVFWGADFDVLKDKIAKLIIGPAEVRLFAGYAGWADGQLEAEIAEGSWLVAPASTQLVFETEARRLWRAALQSLGEDFAILANIPLHPRLN